METELQAHFYLVLLLWQSIPSNWVGPSIICNVCIVYRHTRCVCITSNTLSIAWRYPWKRTLIILYRSSSWMNVKSKETQSCADVNLGFCRIIRHLSTSFSTVEWNLENLGNAKTSDDFNWHLLRKNSAIDAELWSNEKKPFHI